MFKLRLQEFSLFLTLTCLSSFSSSNAFSATTSVNESANFSSYLRPFHEHSLWNSHPINPVLDSYEIPKSTYSPIIHEGAYSTGFFLAKSTDPSVTVKGPEGSGGIWDPDAGVQRSSITIDHWPSDLIPASGSDGHADIFDPINNRVHSFFRLKNIGGNWVATHYAWTKLDGSGWPDPAHFYQGVRAVSVPPSAGLVRKHEVNDGLKIIYHALALSLTFNALSSEPAYIFPATSADGTARENTGKIPEGALLMLPAGFDADGIENPILRKIANTLKVYGAYVVDRNQGTPFAIYVENGAGVNLHKYGWNNTVAADLDKIRKNLRQVIRTDGFVDGKGQIFKPNINLNLLSMRGPWHVKSGNGSGEFDTWQQALTFGSQSSTTILENNSSTSIHPVKWATPLKGQKFKLTSITNGGAKLRFMILDKNLKKVTYDSGELVNSKFDIFTWPADNFIPIIWAISGPDPQSSVSGELVRLEN